MKKTIKTIIVMIMAILMFTMTALPANAAENDFSTADVEVTNSLASISIFSTFGIFPFLVFILIISGFILVFASAFKSKALDQAMHSIVANPCQATADNAVREFSEINGFVRWNLAGGCDSRGVHFTLWRDVFNNVVNPSSQIKTVTKEALRNALIRLNTYGLNKVANVYSKVEIKELKENFGEGGEENVWHNLKSLSGCDVYRNVKIRNGATASEIDAVIIDPKHGIFLLEVKSLGGKKMADGYKYISFNDMREDPTNQIFRHQHDFIEHFTYLNIGSKVKNALVFSWPKDSERRFVDKYTFPMVPYDIITVEQLLGYCKSQPTIYLSDYERIKIAEQLKCCCKEYIFR